MSGGRSVMPLYSICIHSAVTKYTMHNMLLNKDFRELPDHVLFDFYYVIYKKKRLCLLLGEWSNLEVFLRMLNVKHRRSDLLVMFQMLVDHCPSILQEIVYDYVNMCVKAEKITKKLVQIGLSIGLFLSEAGWYKEAHTVLNMTEKCGRDWQTENVLEKNFMLLDCYQRRLFVEAIYALFEEAKVTINKSLVIVKEIEVNYESLAPHLATVFANYAFLYIMRSEFDEAYKWSVKGIRLLNESLPKRTCIFVLRVAAKACVLKRKYLEANFLIKQALNMAKEVYEVDKHPNFADTLMVYAFFLLNYDNIDEGVTVYELALQIRLAAFGKNNIMVALTYEELAYALYVYEYSTGVFHKATEYVEKATRILEKLLPNDHLSLAYTKRIKGLIWEEIALDMNPIDQKRQQEFFEIAEDLHKSALSLSLANFGEHNLQTAKHYGNLGRLYQSMGRQEQAEQMQLLAIKIKKDLLGPDDFEVGLSAGHLASLYNFHMKRYADAEIYYHTAINIAIKLFGDSYSGLEYDYRGLIKVYTELERTDQANKYKEIMLRWLEKRKSPPKLEQWVEMLPVDKIVTKFFSWSESTVQIAPLTAS